MNWVFASASSFCTSLKNLSNYITFKRKVLTGQGEPIHVIDQIDERQYGNRDPVAQFDVPQGLALGIVVAGGAGAPVVRVGH